MGNSLVLSREAETKSLRKQPEKQREMKRARERELKNQRHRIEIMDTELEGRKCTHLT